MKHIFCTNCGTPGKSIDKFCSACGAAFGEVRNVPLLSATEKVPEEKEDVLQPTSDDMDTLPPEVKGAAYGAVVANVLFPKNSVMRKLGEVVGRHVGRRLAAGVPILAVGMDPAAQAMEAQRRAKTKKGKTRRRKKSSLKS
jgi:hypothetical protein